MNSHIHEKAALGFDRAGNSYTKGRPSYPAEAVDWLIESFDLTPKSRILDLAAGTGKFTQLLVQKQLSVRAVEPVQGMRAEFEKNLPTTAVENGSAEHIPFANQTFDAVFVAQAFHWFDGPLAIAEIARVLKPGGKLGLIWNFRDESEQWVRDLMKMVDPFEKDTPRFKSGNWRKAFQETQLLAPLQERHFQYQHVGNVEMIVNRIASISFVAAMEPTVRNDLLQRVREFIETHEKTRGQQDLRFPYVTHVYTTHKT